MRYNVLQGGHKLLLAVILVVVIVSSLYLGSDTALAAWPSPDTEPAASATAAVTPTSDTGVAASPTGETATAPAGANADTTDGITSNAAAGGGGGKNVVRLVNRVDGRLRVKGNVQLNRVPGPDVAPVNLAYAYSSCTDCQTLTVALQINLISKTATRVTPQNAAVAANVECTRCVTGAWAYQYVLSVDDPTQVPKDVSDLIKAMDAELNAVHADKSVTLAQAVSRIRAVISQFQQLAASLDEKHDETSETTSPNATPIATEAASTTPQNVTATSARTGQAATATIPPAPSATVEAPTPTIAKPTATRAPVTATPVTVTPVETATTSTATASAQ
jgi:putative peptide zinc metalloprotease protein